MYRFAVIVTVLCSVFAAGNAGAESQPANFADLKKQYLHLRNTDSHIGLENEWRRTASMLETYAETHRSDAPQSFFNAAKMYRTLYEEKKHDADLKKAQLLYGEIPDRYPAAAIAPEALKELSELSLKYDEDQDKARSFLKRIVKEYPKSEYYDYAFEALYGERGEKSDSGERNVRTDAPVIVLDPGHGGEDFGAVGVSGLLEKDVVLDVAFLLKEELERNMGAKVLLTRKIDTFIPLQRRMEMANEENADIFVSLHANSSETATVRGFEVYVLDNTNDSAAQTLSERENASGGGVDDISFMLSDLIQSSKAPESFSLAQSIQSAFSRTLPGRWPDVKILKVKKAPFYVLVGAHMPAVLAELFFINEPRDGANLAERKFRQDLALALYNGIAGYLKK